MGLVQMKLVQGLFITKEQRPLKTAPIGTESGNPLMHQLIEPLHKELPGLLEPLHHCSPAVISSSVAVTSVGCMGDGPELSTEGAEGHIMMTP
jgi:hypothetical protein